MMACNSMVYSSYCIGMKVVCRCLVLVTTELVSLSDWVICTDTGGCFMPMGKKDGFIGRTHTWTHILYIRTLHI